MKKIIFTLTFLSSLLFIGSIANAQSCGLNGPSVCSPLGGPQGGGFDNPDSVPCIVQGVAYNHAIQFTMFTTFTFAGQQNVDSIEFTSIDSLPCGLCWAVNKTNKRYAANEDGCLNISGTTYANPGQFKLALALKAWINHGPNGLPIPATTVDQTGVRLVLRVKTSTGTCAHADTSITAYNPDCVLSGVAELYSEVSALNLVPNPMNNNGVLSFMAEKNSIYTFRITDVTGKEISVKQLEAKAGENFTTVERNNLPAGVYFISLSNGKSFATKRFAITD